MIHDNNVINILYASKNMLNELSQSCEKFIEMKSNENNIMLIIFMSMY